jgi:hypothetical protein
MIHRTMKKPEVGTMNTTDRDANNTAVPAKRPTMLRRLLSHHELATLLLLLHAPIDASAKPEIPMLHEAGLVETVASEAGAPSIRLTQEGNAVLRGLGIR